MLMTRSPWAMQHSRPWSRQPPRLDRLPEHIGRWEWVCNPGSSTYRFSVPNIAGRLHAEPARVARHAGDRWPGQGSCLPHVRQATPRRRPCRAGGRFASSEHRRNTRATGRCLRAAPATLYGEQTAPARARSPQTVSRVILHVPSTSAAWPTRPENSGAPASTMLYATIAEVRPRNCTPLTS
jgi:hypothetical protein